MRWKGRKRSSNVDDRRSRRGVGMLAGGGIGTLVLVVLIFALGGDPSSFLGGGGSSSRVVSSPEEEALAEFSTVVLADTEDVWRVLFRKQGKEYREPVLVLYRDRVQTPGGVASAAMGPFYMPADEKIYLDLSFFELLRQRFEAPGDFAQAYVIAHEVGHHVQHLLGISDEVHRRKQGLGEVEANRLSVRLELQADFLAGVFAHHADRMKGILEEGDIEEALDAASAIGDDALQRRSGGSVVPDSFTHGTSAQRAAWFRHGYRTGDPAAGDTFDEENFRRIDPGR